ncbi:MAG: hypothetical protein ACE5FH_11420 [Candidatus Zixiibacteriota bacterium]
MLVTTAGAQSDEEVDPVLDFYCKRARAVFKSTDPVERGIAFSILAHTVHKTIGNGGRSVAVDSATTRYFFSFGEPDSLVTQGSVGGGQLKPSLWPPNVFEGDYAFNFFPNDTGGSDLSIGFDTRSYEDSLPVGIAIIDRERCFLKQLYLYYPFVSGHRRFTRSFRFVQKDGFTFPDSIWVVGSKQGVFGADHYRIETGISEIEVRR